MKKLACILVLAVFFALPILPAQQSSSSGSPSQNSQDVPHQKPGGTNNPDMNNQRQPARKPSSGTAQQPSDVPRDNPGTANPDLATQRKPTPKKKKNTKTTSKSTQP
jgi:hypothetical protein